ncbi:hypothetical protein [Sporosarcina sp. FSL K6-1508]|uniref:hypothetical protein n=1 Tax=Sporosarcina sp. FSL K6-1508 TaxID=2921553 RepID=UPI0030FCDD9B
MKLHEIITVVDENNQDMIGEYLDNLLTDSVSSEKAKIHFTFLQKIFEKLAYSNLEILCSEKTQLDIKVNGQSFTKRYEIIKPLRKAPVYEVRYGLSRNEHLRLLFFPFTFEKVSYYIFVKVVVKTLIPDVNETNAMRDLTYNVYLDVKRTPKKYLEGEKS